MLVSPFATPQFFVAFRNTFSCKYMLYVQQLFFSAEKLKICSIISKKSITLLINRRIAFCLLCEEVIFLKAKPNKWEIIEREKANLIDGLNVNEELIRPEILESWKRTIDAGISHYDSKLMISDPMSATGLDYFLDDRPIPNSPDILNALRDYASSTNSTIEITDDKGKLLKILAWPEDDFLTVTNDSEDILGTNAVAMVLKYKKPFQIYGPEHFNANISHSDASSAPIRNTEGEIVGVLNIASRRTRHNKGTMLLSIMIATILEEYHIKEQLFDIIALSQALKGSEKSSSKKLLKSLIERLDKTRHFDEYRNTLSRATVGSNIFNKGRPNTEEESSLRPLTGYEFSDILGESKVILKCKELSKRVAASNAPVLIQGESGTGKELFAQSIHNISQRKDMPFISINCGAIPRELVESELFGYEPGSFTGGLQEGKKGKLEVASGGTLFLDEIESMPNDMQIKFLRVLSTGYVTRIGGTDEIPVDLRIVAATKKNLEIESAMGNFREDLMFRLNVITITLPRLKERKEDIPILVRYFIDSFSEDTGGDSIQIEKNALKALCEYSWPGNIRQLKNVIERAMILMDANGVLQLSDLPMAIVDSLTESFCETATNEKIITQSENGLLYEVQKYTVRKILIEENGNISRAAKRLGISRSAIYRSFKTEIDEYHHNSSSDTSANSLI